ncbi:effector binding domain-containing protein [Paenibacillus ehimensis]|uniref:AraC family transcriptional regulator n=1 Tax=Paenibacillus ehimensis TaxID=79264 RepID=UPI003D29E269
MDYYKRIQGAIQYIEDHLQEELDITAIASAACFSAFHFQRLFQAISGFSVHQYIRRRRLSEAALLLKETGRSVLDIAVALQYGSQEAFTRAFESQFGITPAKYRKESVPLRLQGRVNFLDYQQHAEGELNMNRPEIIDLDAIRIIGYEYLTTLQEEQYFEEIPRFYGEFGSNGLYLKIPGRAAPELAYGIACKFQDDGRFSFVIGEEVHEFTDELEPGFICYEIPKGKYAAFRVDGSAQDTRKYIYGTWLPNSNYERREGPDFEVTDVLKSSYPDHISMVIYIPIE